MSHNNPKDFDADIPDFLIKDLSDKERWLYTSIGKSAKINDYLLKKVDEYGIDLSEIVKQTKITNGRVNKLDEFSKKNNKDLEFLIFVKKAICNKYFLIAVGFVAFVSVRFPIIGSLLSLLRGV